MSDILQILDEHYGVIMIFDVLSKKLHSLKKGLGKKVPEFGMHLSQQVQILQSEYPGRIWPKHMEEMKCDCFYEGLNPKYQCMLAHKIDGENPVGCSNLLLATQKLDRRAEAKDPLLPKSVVTSRLNAKYPQTPGNLFPSYKLKGNHTITAQAVTIGNAKGKADSGAK